MATKKHTPAFMSEQGAGLNQDVFDSIIAAGRVPQEDHQEEKSGFIRRFAGDGILTAVKGAIGVPEAAVGLADIATGGYAGRLAEEAGFRPKEAKAMLDEYYSPEQKAAFAAVQNAANPEDGLGQRILDTGAAALRNPSTIIHAVGESLPIMGAGGVLGRGVMALAPKAAGYAAAGIGEGVMAAGSGAEQMRQQTADGLLTGQQSMLAAGSGALTGGIGAVAGRVAKGMGIGDIDTLIVGGSHVSPALQKGFTRKLLEGAFTEGLMEELPQSVQEQVTQNYALGKPLDEGVDHAVVMGVLSGGAMGMGAQLVSPSAGPLSRAANQTPAVPPAAVVPPAAPGVGQTQATPAAAPPVAPIDPAQEQALLDHANQRAKELRDKANGTKDQKVTTPEGQQVTVPGTPKQFLTDAERQEKAFLDKAGGNAAAIARAYPVLAEQVSQVTPMDPVEAARQQYLQDKEEQEAQAKQAEDERINALIEQDMAQQAQPDDAFWSGGEPLVPNDTNQPSPAQPETQATPTQATTPAREPDTAPAAVPAAGAAAPVVEANGVTQQPAQPVTGQGAGASQPTQTPKPTNQGGSNGNESTQASQAAAKTLLKPATKPVASVTSDTPKGKIIEHTTSKGKVLRGVVRSDLTKDQAFAIDKYSFGKDDGYFIREEHLDKLPDMPAVAADAQEKERWTRMPAADRAAVVARTDLKDNVKKNIVGRAWTTLNGDIRKKLAASMNEPAQAKATSKLPPTDIRIGDTVRKDGADYTVSGAIDGGIKADSTEHTDGITKTETIFLKGDEAIQAKLDAQQQGNTSEPKAPVTQQTSQEESKQQGITPAATQPAADSGMAAESEAEVAKPKKKPAGASNLRKGAYAKNPLMTFLATHGMYHEKGKPNSMKSEFSPDKAIMVAGYGPIFKRTGKDYSSLVPMAIEDGYLPQGGTASELYDLIHRAFGGEKIVPMYAEGIADQFVEQAFEDHLAQQQEAAQDEDYDPFEFAEALGFDMDDAEIAGYDAASDPIKLEVNALLAKAEELGIDTYNIKEDAAYATQSESEQAYYEAARSALQNAITTGSRDRIQDAGTPSNTGEQEGLTAPTRADVLAQQERADNAQELDDRAQIDAEASRQTLTSQTAPEQRTDTSGDMFAMEKAQAVIDKRNAGSESVKDPNQPGMFDEQNQPAAQEPVKTVTVQSPDALRAQADLQAALADLGDIFGKNTRLNMIPEQEAKILPVMVKLFDAAFRIGYHKFMDAAKFALDKIRAALGDEVADDITLEHLQGAYISMSSGKTGVDGIRVVSNIEAKTEIENHTAQTDNERNGETDVPSTNASVERDSPVASTEPAVGDSIQDDATGTASRPGKAGGRTTGSAGRGQQDGAGVSTGGATAGGERSDQRLHPTGQQPELTGIITGADFSEPGGNSGITGVPVEPITASQVDAVADKRTTGIKNTIERNKANNSPVVLADLDSIKATLPQLLPGQQEDVKLAETRFAKADGYGMLFTNGTGTGKTFTGLGIIKRHALQGKTNTLIVAPDNKIASDWIDSGKLLGMDITQLADTKDAGKGIVITTYANLGANDSLAKRQWDLVVADEAHSLMQAADGEPTGYLYNLRAITYHPDGAHTRHNMLNRDKLNHAAELGNEITTLEAMQASDSSTVEQRSTWNAKSEKLQAELGALRKELDASQKAMRSEVDVKQGADRTRLVALSATPFAYEKAIDWANGYLFDYNEGQTSDKTEFRGYNQGSNKDRYMMQHFGYSMRYNKMTRPDANVDSGLMQRQWNANLKKSGALSGRMLDVVPDYDRRFILIESAIGNRIDEALEWISEQRQAEKGGQGPYAVLSDAINEQFKYLQKRYLLEAIKADAAIPIVKQHMALGRKVVVFHDYKQGGGFNPFRVNSSDSEIKSALSAFNEKFSDLVSHPFDAMPSPIDIFSREIPGVLLINGDEKKADLLKRYKSFQDDSTGPQVVLVQSAKNKGWSGHDTTGKHQRVLINLGQPTAPTLAIQQEGRIYRTGQASDAIMRYMNTGTNWERWTFASTIATRASTAENLGMGEMARALKDSFIQSFEESDTYEPGHEGEGKGGKERDKAANDAITEYDRAKTFYFGQQKKNSRTKAQEGADYFATPEPVGLKMVQWLDARGGESTFEPSAGHGAIARWLLDNTSRTAIEPSFSLRSKLALVMEMKETGDRILSGTFEDHHVSNKYDGIVMNPPFGTAGRTAIDHLAKAATHLRDGGRIVALLPDGPSANAKFDKWFYESSEKPVKPLLAHPTHGAIYKGDTVTSRASFIPNSSTGITVDSIREGVLQTKVMDGGRSYLTSITPESITGVKPTGKRTESVNLAEGLALVATIKLPAVTFERAGTAVATRIVVIEKNGANVMQRDLDYSDITDIKELFDKLENLDFAARTKPVEVAPVAPVAADKPAKAEKPTKVAANAGDEVTIGGTKYEIEIYTTNAGKEKRGVWMASKAEAMKYSARAFTHSSNKGKWFVDEYWFPKDAEIIKPSFSRRSASGNRLPDVVIGHKLGALSSHPDYAAAKAGNTEAALRIALDMVDDAMIEAVRKAANGADVIIPVVSVEATGRNKIPLAVAEVLADRLGTTAESQIVQADSPKRTSMDGLSRLLSPPVFDGPVQEGASYVLVDDTVTQGGTFASLASHIRDNGGEVSAVVALTGKQYSAKLALSPELLSQVREQFQSVEDKFRAATGYGFDALTESEARYLAKHNDAQSVRDRITEAGNAAGVSKNTGNTRFSTTSKTSSRSLTTPQVTSIIDAIKARWANAPNIVVVESMDDPAIPQAVRDENTKQQSKGATGEPEGFYYGGKVYVVASTMNNSGDVIRVLFHESLGHAGLRGVFGDKLDGILKQLAGLRRPEVAAKAAQYGLDMNVEDERLQAAEEVLAEMAQTKPELGFVKRAISLIRGWLRANVPGFGGMKLTDADIIAQFILPARRFIESKVAKNVTSDTPAKFSRSIGAALTAGLNSARDVQLPAGYLISDLIGDNSRLHWWHKTIGTQYNLAQKSAPFKRVYDSIQRFLNDVSFFAAEAADLAPSILPKLDKIADILKSPLSAADTKALSAPVFEGTLTWGRNANGRAVPTEEVERELSQVTLDDRAHRLVRDRRLSPDVLRMWQGLPQDQYETIINNKFEREYMRPGVVFTDGELTQHFSLTPEQIKLYREFRKATDKSIDNLAISEMLKHAGQDADPVRDQALAADSVDDAGQLLRDYLVSLVTLQPERDKVLSATAAKMLDIAAHATDMKDRGYAPLSRFGQYTLEATLPTGERYFSMFESARERNKVQRLLELDGATEVSTGTMSQEAHKLLKGITPETAALFGEMLGLDEQGDSQQDVAFQEFIKRATANRSAMKRLLKRKGIAGFSDDAGRVLAGFIYSNSRRTASNLHSKETSSAVDAIPKEQGQLKDTAVRLQEYVSNPQEEAQAFRGILFAQYLGGSVASAMINATQPFTVTLPYLSQFGGIRKASAQMTAAVRDAARKHTGDAALDEALKKAEEEGIVSPQEVHALQAQAMGKAQLKSGDGTTTGDALALASNGLSKLALAWGKVFGVAEQFNRRTTFIAAYRTAVEQGMADPAGFAEKTVSETQFVYNKGNKPRYARGAIGSTLFTFKQYTISYLEMVERMATAGTPGSEERAAGRKAALLAIAILFMLGGADGLPFIGDIEDVIDGAMQRLGYNFSSKQRMKSFLMTELGKDGAEFVMSGVSGLPGMPIDVSGRLGMGNLIPGTGIFQKKTDHTRDLMEIAGPAGDMAKRSFMATEQALSGNLGKAMETISPVAARNITKGINMSATGEYSDTAGRKVIDTTGSEAFLKAIGFQPRSVKNVQDATSEAQRSKSQYILAHSEMQQAMAQAIYSKDDDMKRSVREDLADWNENNPDQRMTLNMPAVLRRVREMHKTKEQRMADTAPKAIRAQVRAQLKEELR